MRRGILVYCKTLTEDEQQTHTHCTEKCTSILSVAGVAIMNKKTQIYSNMFTPMQISLCRTLDYYLYFFLANGSVRKKCAAMRRLAVILHQQRFTRWNVFALIGGLRFQRF